MRPDEIEDLLYNMNQPALEQVSLTEDDPDGKLNPLLPKEGCPVGYS